MAFGNGFVRMMVGVVREGGVCERAVLSSMSCASQTINQHTVFAHVPL
jgi:hypothetical protein